LRWVFFSELYSRFPSSIHGALFLQSPLLTEPSSYRALFLQSPLLTEPSSYRARRWRPGLGQERARRGNMPAKCNGASQVRSPPRAVRNEVVYLQLGGLFLQNRQRSLNRTLGSLLR
jgi:hypothetical protein